MRKLPVLLVAALAALSPISAASAHGSPTADEAAANCAPPDIVAQYHPDHMSLHVTLSAAGCPTRENRDFSMSAWLDRTEGRYTEGYGQVVACGPYPASDAARRPQDRIYVCELHMARDHPSPESASYDISVHFPGADGEETVESHSFCTTGDDGAYCYEPREQ
jgi:hypothetical protein